MIGEILAISAVGAVAFTVVDHENLLGNNPLKKFWWERPPFTAVTLPARPSNQFSQPAIARPQTGENRIKAAQATMGVCQREIMVGLEEQNQQAFQPQNGQSKYQLSR